MYQSRNRGWYQVLWLSFAATFAGEAFAEDAPDYAHCDPHLGANYDESSPVARHARQNKYFICVTQQIYGRLRTGLRQQINELNQWQTRNGHTAQRSIRTNGKTAVSELKLTHSAQRMELNADHANRLNQVGAEPSQNVRAERNELTGIFQAESQQMNLRHNAERKELQNIIHGCASSVAREIKAMWDDEFQNLTEQYQSKTSSVRTRSSQIRNTPYDSSVSSYAASDSEPHEAVVDTPPPPPLSPDAPSDALVAGQVAATPSIESAETTPEGGCQLVFLVTSTIAVVGEQPLRNTFVYTSRLIDGAQEVEEVAIRGYGPTSGTTGC